MGHGIAQVAAAADYEVILLDVNDESLKRGRQSIERNLARGVQLGKVTAEDRDRTLARISLATGLDAVRSADLIIEAAPENLELKQNLLRQTEAATSENCIWATNTSSLSISEVARSAARPE